MQDVALLTDADKDDGDTDKVSLMTVHAAKGLEFPYVFVVGLEENLFPSIQSISTRAELEEERRLFYVAITRAMKKVTLSHAESRYRWGQFTITEPSRFLDEIDEALIDKPRRAKARPQHGFKTTPTIPPRPGMKKVGESRANAEVEKERNNTHFESSDPAAFQTGMQVEHPKFGKGKVLSVEGQGPNKKATVFFNAIGKKNLLLRFAKLRIIS